MKKLSIFSLTLVLAATTVHGQAEKSAIASNSPTTLEKMKFGPQVGLSPASKYGVFVEYKIKERGGVRSGLFYTQNRYAMIHLEEGSNKATVASPRYVSMPIILRGYSGQDRQFCLFFGLQPSYVIGGDMVKVSLETSDLEGALDALEKLNKERSTPKKIKQNPDTRSFELGGCT